MLAKETTMSRGSLTTLPIWGCSKINENLYTVKDFSHAYAFAPICFGDKTRKFTKNC